MQNVNLYQVPRKVGGPSRNQQMLALAALLVLLAVAHGLWSAVQLWRMETPLQQAEQQAVVAEQALQAAQAEFVEPLLDAQLPLQLASDEADNQQLQQLMDYLQVLARQQRVGFVAPLLALSERHPPEGLWLSEIRMAKGGEELSLDGFTQDQELLPQYLHSLGRSEVFQGREFARFDVKRESSGLLQFRLSSQADEGKAEHE